MNDVMLHHMLRFRPVVLHTHAAVKQLGCSCSDAAQYLQLLACYSSNVGSYRGSRSCVQPGPLPASSTSSSWWSTAQLSPWLSNVQTAAGQHRQLSTCHHTACGIGLQFQQHQLSACSQTVSQMHSGSTQLGQLSGFSSKSNKPTLKSALRSLYKKVHPDLFTDFPAEKVCHAYAHMAHVHLHLSTS